jgi:transglutaminase-like putative cysteine protease
MSSCILLIAALMQSAPAATPDVLTLKRPAEGEWMGIYLLGHKAGYSYSRLEKGKLDGKPVLIGTEDTTLKANVGGKVVSRRVREVKTYAWEPHGALLRLSALHEGDGGDEKIEIRFGPKKAEVTRRRPGEAVEQMTLPASADVVENADLVRLVAALHKNMTGRVFDSQTLKDKKEQVEDRGPGELLAAGVRAKVERIAVTEDDGSIAADTAVSVDDGRVLELRFGGALLAVPEPETVAKRLDTIDLFALTRVEIDQKLPSGNVPATITYRIEGLPPTLRPPSSRQTYTDLPGGGVNLTVTAALPTGTAQLPVAGQDEFIHSTPAIESDDPKIRALAKQIVGDDRDARSAAVKLSSWVFANLRKGYGVSSDRATDVLRRREGDCTEHSLLLVALARSVGIPARLIHGLVYAQGSDGRYGLYWHEWVEVYAGQWIAIDPTFGQPVADATHIELGQGDQTDAVALMGQLKVTAVNVGVGGKSAPTPPEGQGKGADVAR